MELKRIRCFIEVARLKSFSKAAKVLYVSQTAVSQQIATLEEMMSVKLFERDKKEVKLTIAGETFLSEAKQLVRLYDNAILKTQAYAQGVDGVIKLGFFSMLDRDVMSNVIADFYRKYPKTQISIVQCNYGDMKNNILNNTIDLGFCFQLDSIELNELKIYEQLPKLCVNKKHRLASKSLITSDDIIGESIISYNKNVEQQKVYESHHDEGNPGLEFNHSFLLENMDDTVMLVSTNVGITFLPEIENYVNPNKIVFIDQNIEEVPFEVKAYWKKDTYNPSLSKFIDTIKIELTNKL
ncbi:LysR family transcriptional regulator [[Clostridium] fimetarium]|uniref:DNA-binding transcriptional regulator, LysR family n=1 Tax=[Clostridium] fimetarium TaxID=99656 RepID=A0A1I0PGR1_9FIRM|nr:LysR family transcriptional regulator [[Clostridium] fimetarium]SEW12879.1 DNA-binding transcriptional regulator, LysR family [[Clostridium] fimetarium]